MDGSATNTWKACDCPHCRTLCTRNPGWMTPEEATAAMDAGLAGKLMRDWLDPCHQVGNDENIYVLAPASVGCEGDDAPEMPSMSFIAAIFSNWCKGPCVMHKDGLCSIHDSGFKPIQCRLSLGCDDVNTNEYGHPASNYDVAKQWDTDAGRAVITRWQVEVGHDR